MTDYRKHLRDMSILVLIFSAISLVTHILSLLSLGTGELPEGATAGLVLATQITMGVFAFILMIPRLYIGVKGIKVAKNPDSSKGHIVWAIILAVFAVFAALSAVSELTNGLSVDAVINVVGEALNVAIYVLYIVCAKNVRKAA